MSAARITTTGERARKRPSDRTEAQAARVAALAAAWRAADEAHDADKRDEAFEALEVALACLCEGKARTLRGALAQLLCLGSVADFLCGYVDDPAPNPDQRMAARDNLRRLNRVLYSVRAVLAEAVGGDVETELAGDHLMGLHADPHATEIGRIAA